jgi:epoxyqueuosine reductase
MLKSSQIKAMGQEMGADIIGITPVQAVDNGENLIKWLEYGYHGEMKYLERNIDIRLNPLKLFPEARSIIVIGVNYFRNAQISYSSPPAFKVALYAQLKDYHIVLRKVLKRLLRKLQIINPNATGRICVDTAPFMDKYWAQMAGLGWQGKHTNLVSRHFSGWLVLGSLITNIEFDEYDTPHSNHCGNCRKCLDSCPTGALIGPYQIDATRCISYWTIESKADSLPQNIQSKLNGWVFGCDICLLACPFNRFQKVPNGHILPVHPNVNHILNGTAINLTQDNFNSLFAGSPLKRPGLMGIKRNILAAKIRRSFMAQ